MEVLLLFGIPKGLAATWAFISIVMRDPKKKNETAEPQGCLCRPPVNQHRQNPSHNHLNLKRRKEQNNGQ